MISPVAYHLQLPAALAYLHDMSHVLLLKPHHRAIPYHSDPGVVILLLLSLSMRLRLFCVHNNCNTIGINGLSIWSSAKTIPLKGTDLRGSIGNQLQH